MNPTQTFVSALLIMSSIFLGFQVDRWWEEKRERVIEQSYLQRLNTDLEVDKVNVNRRIEYFTAIRVFGASALEFIAEPEIGQGREAELLVAFYLATHAWEFTPASSTFEELKSAGILTLIRDVAVRNAVLIYYLDLANANYVWRTPNYYRRTARSLIPPNVQKTLWDACHELTDVAMRQRFIADCKPDISEDDIQRTLDKLLKSTMLEADLNFLVANIDVSLVLYREHGQLINELIAQVSGALTGPQ